MAGLPWEAPGGGDASGVGTGNINTTLQDGNRLFASLLDLLQNLFPRTFGTFTMPAASSYVVTDSTVGTGTYILPPIPVNASAATLMSSAQSLYVVPANGQFTVFTASGVAAAGTEQFKYVGFTPV